MVRSGSARCGSVGSGLIGFGKGIKVWHGSVRSNAGRLGRARHGGRVLCGAVSHGLLWCGKDFAARRGDAWFAQVWSRKVWHGKDIKVF